MVLDPGRFGTVDKWAYGNTHKSRDVKRHEKSYKAYKSPFEYSTRLNQSPLLPPKSQPPPPLPPRRHHSLGRSNYRHLQASSSRDSSSSDNNFPRCPSFNRKDIREHFIERKPRNSSYGRYDSLVEGGSKQRGFFGSFNHPKKPSLMTSLSQRMKSNSYHHQDLEHENNNNQYNTLFKEPPKDDSHYFKVSKEPCLLDESDVYGNQKVLNPETYVPRRVMMERRNNDNTPHSSDRLGCEFKSFSNKSSKLYELFKRQVMCDVILCTADGKVQAHKIALCLHSSTLVDIFSRYDGTEVFSVNLTDFSGEVRRWKDLKLKVESSKMR